MGGSSSRRSSAGYSFDSAEARRILREEIQKAEADLADQKYQIEVAEAISTALGQINGRDAEKTGKQIEQIKRELESDLEGSIDLLFGGSVAKHTHVDGLSDIDTLVILNNTELSDKSPDEVRSYFANTLRERLTDGSVTVGRLAVTVVRSGLEVQLLPALRHGDELKIPSAAGDSWSRIKPKAFTDALTAQNQLSGGKIVPTIKLAKSIIAQLPEKFQLSGYHIEALALKIFRGYKGPMTTKNCLEEFFCSAPQHLLAPIPDKTGQSAYVDEYLGSAGGAERQAAALALERVGRVMAQADKDKSVRAWSDLIGMA